mmetsp:Transcript_32378/g.94746  ORF Transcript_32378/g.94746 Transcript_32378/m.94746 type:complete len:257 (-) Transcript_32378:357-1127(-)
MRSAVERQDAPDVEVGDFRGRVDGALEPPPELLRAPIVGGAWHFPIARVLLPPTEDVRAIVGRAQGHLGQRGEALRHLLVRPNEAVAGVGHAELCSLRIRLKGQEEDEQSEGGGAVAAARDQPGTNAHGLGLVLCFAQLDPEDVHEAALACPFDNLDDVEHPILVIGRHLADRQDVQPGSGARGSVDQPEDGHMLPGLVHWEAAIGAVSVRRLARPEALGLILHEPPRLLQVRVPPLHPRLPEQLALLLVPVRLGL